MINLVGIKIGMTRIIHNNLYFIPVTIIKILDHFIVNIIKLKNTNYNIMQLTTGKLNIKNSNKPILGYYKKRNILPGIKLWGTKIFKEHNFKIKEKINIEYFKNIKNVNITGISKGKGFSGVIKRWGFKSQDNSHGNSLSHRAPGSIGQNQSPGRVFKGKKMAGHKGNNKITIKNLKIIKIDIENNLLIIKGCIPGSNNNKIIIKSN